jgi:hypothetical protein
MAGLAKVLAVCGATAAGGATCVATNVVTPTDIGLGAKHQRAAAVAEQPAPPPDRPANEAPPAAPVAADAGGPTAAEPAGADRPPAEEVNRQFSFEQPAAKSGGSEGSGDGEFGAPSGGGSSGGAGGAGGGGGFSFEK